MYTLNVPRRREKTLNCRHTSNYTVVRPTTEFNRYYNVKTSQDQLSALLVSANSPTIILVTYLAFLLTLSVVLQSVATYWALMQETSIALLCHSNTTKGTVLLCVCLSVCPAILFVNNSLHRC